MVGADGISLMSTRHRTLVDAEQVRSIYADVVASSSAVGGAPSPHGSHRASVTSSCSGADMRYMVEANWLITGRPQDAARGINFYLKASDADLHEKMIHGVASIRREFADHGTEEDKECLHYILNERAGSSAKEFSNGLRDEGRNGETLADFVSHPSSQNSGLTEAHVLALRLYTSAAYNSINQPLRDLERKKPHPFPVTVHLIAEGLKRLRTVAADHENAHKAEDLWRGMRNLRVTDTFSTDGGTELAPLSTTTDMVVALRYAISPESLLFKVVTSSFMERGVNLEYLSCFPGEAEHLFPPLTYLRPTGNTQVIECGTECSVTVVEVTPIFGT